MHREDCRRDEDKTMGGSTGDFHVAGEEGGDSATSTGFSRGRRDRKNPDVSAGANAPRACASSGQEAPNTSADKSPEPEALALSFSLA